MSVANAKRVVFTGPGTVEIQPWQVPELGPKDVLIENHYTMVSPGTELHVLLGDHTRLSTYPRNSGYIGSGTVAKTGSEVTRFQVGDPVLSSSSHMSHCVQPEDRFDLTRRLDEVPEEQAVYAVLCGIALYGVRAAEIGAGESVLVLGQGLIGQLAAQFARIEGGRPVIAADMDEGRLELARACGAHVTVNPGRTDLNEAVLAATGGDGAHKIIECTATTRAIGQAFDLAAYAGTIVVLGGIHGKVELDLYTHFQIKCLTMKGVHGPQCPRERSPHHRFTYGFNRDAILRLMASGELSAAPLTTHRVPYHQAPETYALLQQRDERALGVLFDWSEIHAGGGPCLEPQSGPPYP